MPGEESAVPVTDELLLILKVLGFVLEVGPEISCADRFVVADILTNAICCLPQCATTAVTTRHAPAQAPATIALGSPGQSTMMAGLLGAQFFVESPSKQATNSLSSSKRSSNSRFAPEVATCVPLARPSRQSTNSGDTKPYCPRCLSQLFACSVSYKWKGRPVIAPSVR